MTRSQVALTALAAILVVCTTGIVSAWSTPFGAPHSAIEMPTSSLMGWIFAEQAAFYRSLSHFILRAKEDGTAMWELFGISLIYGVFHAVGPGHGKAVISSYLVANGETWRRGVALSFVSAAIQSAVAIVVVAVAAVLLGATAKAIGLTVHLVEITSYALVILIGVRLLHVKGRGFLIACRELGWHQAPGQLFASAPAANNPSAARVRLSEGRPGAMAMRGWQCQIDGCTALSHGYQCHHDHEYHASAWGHAHGPEPAALAGVGGWRRGLTAVMAVGLRPCSGAIIVLIFALAQDLFWTGVGATLIMGLGTAVTVAGIATVAVGARGLAGRVAQTRAGLGMLVMRAIEVGAAGLIVAFGILLLAGYMASERLWMFTG